MDLMKIVADSCWWEKNNGCCIHWHVHGNHYSLGHDDGHWNCCCIDLCMKNHSMVIVGSVGMVTMIRLYCLKLSYCCIHSNDFDLERIQM